MNPDSSSRLVTGYRTVALFGLNVALFFLAANLLAAGVLGVDQWLERRALDPVSQKYGDALRQMYPTMTPSQLDTLLAESWGRTLVFEPYTQITERPIRGRFVNVDSMGFRHSVDQASWPPDPDRFNVFLFGGSTAFSYGLPDDQTVASHLQTQLRRSLAPHVQIYNFGRAWYYSTQERILFEQLLTQGFQPDLAVFLDGLNDFAHNDDRPYLSDFLEYAIREGRFRDPPSVLSKLPVYEFARRVAVKVGVIARSPAIDPATADRTSVPEDDPRLVDRVIDRLTHHISMVSALGDAYGVETWFVLQPVPTYNYDLTHHLFGDDLGRHEVSKVGYPELARQVAEGWGGPRLIWCGDIQQDVEAPLYVDEVHYSNRMARMVAQCIADGAPS